MTNQEILNYFNTAVYTFSGPLTDLDDLQQSNRSSYTYLIVGDILYFTSENPAVDARVKQFTGE